MKYRSTILVILLSLSLAACSLAEDITPPPGFASPTSILTIVPATQTPVPPSTSTYTPTITSAGPSGDATATTTGSTPITTVTTSEITPNTTATTSVITPNTTDSTTPPVDASPTPQTSVVTVSGTVTVASGNVIPSGINATLLLYNTTSGQVSQTLTVPIQTDGKYEFTGVPGEPNTVYLVTVDYSGVTYDSVPATYDATRVQYDLPLTVYETTNDLNVLTITQAHLQFDFSTTGKVQLMVLYVITNPGGKAVTVPSDGSTVPFISIPTGAQSVNFQLAQSSSPLLSATNGFAMLPGADKQYGIIATFTLPYTNRMMYSQPFSLPVSSATIIVPEGVKVKSDQLTDAGTQASTGTTSATFHLFQASGLATGSTLTMTISGMPGDKAGFALDQRTLIFIGVGVLGLILIGLGILLFLRDRKLRKLEEGMDSSEDEGSTDALGEDREGIMDAIIALDDQYKAGGILKDAYEKRREELKERLKNLT